MKVRVSMLLKSRASPDMLPFSLCNKKGLAIQHMNRQTPLSNETIDSVQRHREVGWAKDLSAPPGISHFWGIECLSNSVTFHYSVNSHICAECKASSCVWGSVSHSVVVAADLRSCEERQKHLLHLLRCGQEVRDVSVC